MILPYIKSALVLRKILLRFKDNQFVQHFTYNFNLKFCVICIFKRACYLKKKSQLIIIALKVLLHSVVHLFNLYNTDTERTFLVVYIDPFIQFMNRLVQNRNCTDNFGKKIPCFASQFYESLGFGY